MANELTYTQIATVLNDVVQMATGVKSIAPTNTAQFVSVAQTALKVGYDPLINAISQVMTKTIFSIRPYYAKFNMLKVNRQKFGAITRKLKILDKDFEEDQRFDLEDGQSVDMFKVNKPRILQTNFYGQTVYQRHYTIFKDQLDLAFTTPDQYGQFLSMVATNCNDLITVAEEQLGRYTVANLMAGTSLSRPSSVIHLLSEYNAATGQAVLQTEILKPEYFKPFILWLYSRIAQLSEMMTERTVMYQTNITGKDRMSQHSPIERQKMLLYTPWKTMIDSMVMPEVFHNTNLKLPRNKSINFWQQPETPDQLEISPVYMDTTGELINGGVTNMNNVFGIIFDEDAAGYTAVNEWSAPTPFNAAGGYTNIFFHWTDRYWNDFTEKAILLLMD